MLHTIKAKREKKRSLRFQEGPTGLADAGQWLFPANGRRVPQALYSVAVNNQISGLLWKPFHFTIRSEFYMLDLRAQNSGTGWDWSLLRISRQPFPDNIDMSEMLPSLNLADVLLSDQKNQLAPHILLLNTTAKIYGHSTLSLLTHLLLSRFTSSRSDFTWPSIPLRWPALEMSTQGNPAVTSSVSWTVIAIQWHDIALCGTEG